MNGKNLSLRASLLLFWVGLSYSNGTPLEIGRLKYLQFSSIYSDLIVVGTPKILNHVKTKNLQSLDLVVSTPDTIYLEINRPKIVFGSFPSETLPIKIVAFFPNKKFEIANNMLFFLSTIKNEYFVIDFKRVSKDVFHLEQEVIDTNKVVEKGMIGSLSINRNWSKDWMALPTEEFSLEDLKSYVTYIRDTYMLVPYCFHSPIDISVYFLPKKNIANYRGELAVLNGITNMMVRKSLEKKQWLENNATRVDMKDNLCRSIRYD